MSATEIIDMYGREEAYEAERRAEAIERFLENNTLAPGCEIDFIPTVPQSGDESPETLVIRRPPMDSFFAEMPA